MSEVATIDHTSVYVDVEKRKNGPVTAQPAKGQGQQGQAEFDAETAKVSDFFSLDNMQCLATFVWSYICPSWTLIQHYAGLTRIRKELVRRAAWRRGWEVLSMCFKFLPSHHSSSSIMRNELYVEALSRQTNQPDSHHLVSHKCL